MLSNRIGCNSQQYCLRPLLAAAAFGSILALPSVPANSQELGRSNDEGTALTVALQEIVESSRAKVEAPALWAGVFKVQDHQIVESETTIVCTGVRKFGDSHKVTKEDLVHLGSCTKAMTATLIAQAISQSKHDKTPLKFESTLAETFLKIDSLASSKWATVTIQELLCHRSGAPANAKWFELQSQFPDDPVASRKALLEWLVKQPRPTRPKYQYSNVGYALLGHVLEERMGKPWESIIQEQLFAKLDINSAGFGPVAGDGQVEQPWGHVTDQGLGAEIGRGLGELFGRKSETQWNSQQIDNAVPLGPAGRCHMRLGDWAKFVVLFASKTVDPRLNIDEQTWSKLLDTKGQSPGMPYAGGWIVVGNTSDANFRLNHAGSNTTWYCIADVYPSRGEFTLVASNSYSDSITAECDNLLRKLVMLPTKLKSKDFKP
ncbi:MAG: serine hydrolase domain-containing protein [Pirellulaceae bacterium]